LSSFFRRCFEGSATGEPRMAISILKMAAGKLLLPIDRPYKAVSDREN
jgi:hypothetical protein